MTLRLYNTLTKEKEVFEPVNPAHVRMYVCGPTVYDFAHIGNARPVIVFDVLYRLLKHLAAKGEWDGGKGETAVHYVRNITDVDDKINARAAVDYPDLPLNEAIRRVTEKTNTQFQADVTALGCLPPSQQPRATEHIDGMKAMIERLVARGVAYVAEGHVLFSPAAMDALDGVLPRYGALARRSLDEMIAGARVDVAPYKRDATDFVLWKPSADNEPGWPSPAGIEGRGRPGWHIECSAMSMAKLLEPFGGGLNCDDPTKNTFDIHGGGIDLVFPHHENEIAQSCCAFNAPRMASIWMHNGFLQVEGEKMSKSLGNFVTIRELLEEWPGDVLRLNMLSSHYRQPIDWTWKGVNGARNELLSWANLVHDRISSDKPVPSAELVEALEDDLNFPAMLAVLRADYRLAIGDGGEDAQRQLSQNLKFLGFEGLDKPWSYKWGVSDDSVEGIDPAVLIRLEPAVQRLRAAAANNDVAQIAARTEEIQRMGVSVDIGRDGEIELRGSDNRVDTLILARSAARKAKNFAEADRIRNELDAMGIALKDAKDPGTGEIVTTWEVKR